MNKKNIIKAGIFILGMFVFSPLFAEGEKQNLVKNGGFETLDKRSAPVDWLWDEKRGPWSKLTGISLDNKVKWSGLYSLRLKATEYSNLSLTQYLPQGSIKPNAKYRLTYYIKAENIQLNPEIFKSYPGFRGVCVNVWIEYNRWFPYPFFEGTIRWAKQGFEFTTGEKDLKTLYIQPLLTGASGIVWFDDLRLEEIY